MTSTSDQRLRVAIVGGGISGLATAYYLMARARRLGARLNIELFETTQTLGGNADTVVVKLGRYKPAQGESYDYLRCGRQRRQSGYVHTDEGGHD